MNAKNVIHQTKQKLRRQKLKEDICKVVGHTQPSRKCKCKRCGIDLPIVVYEQVGMVIHNKKRIVKIELPDSPELRAWHTLWDESILDKGE